jgi:hypothetical protein
METQGIPRSIKKKKEVRTIEISGHKGNKIGNAGRMEVIFSGFRISGHMDRSQSVYQELDPHVYADPILYLCNRGRSGACPPDCDQSEKKTVSGHCTVSDEEKRNFVLLKGGAA